MQTALGGGGDWAFLDLLGGVFQSLMLMLTTPDMADLQNSEEAPPSMVLL